jgi:hypothetical protein
MKPNRSAKVPGKIKLTTTIFAAAMALLLIAPGASAQTASKPGSDLSQNQNPTKSYRLTYTITETDNGKHVGLQHFSMIVVPGQRTTLKQGSKIPIVTGSYTATSATAMQTQMTYLDVGMNFDATLDEMPDGLRLLSKVEQSSIAEEKSGVGAQDPIVRQTVIQGASLITVGKPLLLGSIDILGSTRHLDIEAVVDPVK